MSHRFTPLLALTLLTACNPSPEPIGNDPMKPFAVRRVFARDGYAYASVIFKSARDRSDGPEGIVVIDMQSLFVDGNPLSNERVNPEGAQNVWIWDSRSEIWGRLGANLVGLNAGSGTVDLYSLADPVAPALSSSVTVPITGDPAAGAGIRQFNALDETTAAVETFDGTNPTLVVVRPGAPAGQQILSQTTLPDGGCGTIKVRAARAYCIHTIGTLPVENANVRVFEWSDSSGLGALVQSLTVANLYSSPGAYFAADGSLHILDRGLGTGRPPGVAVFDVDGDGKLTYRTKFTTPSSAIPVSGFGFSAGSVVLGTLSGAFELDASTGTEIAAETSLNAAFVTPADGLSAEYFVGGAGDSGITLYRAGSGSITRVKTYHRSYGDRFPNYGTIYESAY
jgi:hypothetical protein